VRAGLRAAAKVTDAFGEAAHAEKDRRAAGEIRDGAERFLDRIASADILVETEAINHERLRAANPSLVHVTVTPFGLAAEWRMSIGTDVLDEGVAVCRAIAADFPRAVFFSGKLIFEHERFFQRLLHNETAQQLQRRLQFNGMPSMVLPLRVMERQEPAQIVAGAA